MLNFEAFDQRPANFLGQGHEFFKLWIARQTDFSAFFIKEGNRYLSVILSFGFGDCNVRNDCGMGSCTQSSESHLEGAHLSPTVKSILFAKAVSYKLVANWPSLI